MGARLLASGQRLDRLVDLVAFGIRSHPAMHETLRRFFPVEHASFAQEQPDLTQGVSGDVAPSVAGADEAGDDGAPVPLTA